jgi:hypothetical protein
MTTDEVRMSPPSAYVAVVRSTDDAGEQGSLAESWLDNRPDGSGLDGDRAMRALEWLLVALCALTVGLLSLVH